MKAVVQVSIPIQVTLDEEEVRNATIAEELNNIRAIIKEAIRDVDISFCEAKVVFCEAAKFVEH